MGTLAAPPYATQVDLFFNDQPEDVIEIGEISAYQPDSPADVVYYIAWNRLDTLSQQMVLDHVEEYGGTVPFAGPVDGFQTVLYTSPVALGDPTGLDTTMLTAGSHTVIYNGLSSPSDTTNLVLETNAVSEITEFVARAANSAPGPLAGTHFTLNTADPTAYYVWYSTQATAANANLRLDSIPADATYFTLGDPSNDYYVYFADTGNRELTDFNFSTNTIEGGDHFLLTANGNDYYVWYNDSVNEVFTVDFGSGAGASLAEGTYWTFSDGADDFYVWYDRPALPVEATIDTTGVDGSTLTGGEYFVLSTPSVDYYVWFQVDGVGADPAPGGTGVLVEVESTDTENNLSEKIEAEIRGLGTFFVTDSAQTVFTVRSLESGLATTPADVDSGVTIAVVNPGRDAGVDPAPGGTGIRVVLDEDNTDADAVTSTLLRLDDEANVTVAQNLALLTVNVNAAANVTDAADVDSGLSVTVDVQGAATSVDPAPPGRTGIQVDIVGNETAAELAELSQVAMAAGLAGDATVTLDAPTIVRTIDVSVGPQGGAAQVDSGVSIVIVPGTSNTTVDPAPVGFVSLGAVQYISGVGGSTLADVEEALRILVDGDPNFTAAAIDGGGVFVTAANTGLATSAADVDSGIVVVSATTGSDASVDPAPGGTGIEVGIVSTDSAVEIATLTKEAIENVAGADFNVTQFANRFVVENTLGGAAVDATNGDTNFAINITQDGVDPTPLTYTATVYVDGTPNAVEVDPAAATTFADLINEINADLTGATAAIVGGNITITTDTFGPDGSVFIVDGDLFKSTEGELRLATPVAAQGTLYDASFIVDGVLVDMRLPGQDIATFSGLVTSIEAASGGTLRGEIDANGNVKILTQTAGGDETSNGSVRIVPRGVFEQTSGFRGYGIPKAGADTFLDSLFLTEGPGGDTMFQKLGKFGRPPKPLVGTGINNVNEVYYNGSAWVRVIDDTPV